MLKQKGRDEIKFSLVTKNNKKGDRKGPQKFQSISAKISLLNLISLLRHSRFWKEQQSVQ